MSKCRQFEGLSTGIFTWTIPNHTIKLQLHRPVTQEVFNDIKIITL